METMISLQHVTRCFETVKVLSDVSFTVEKGSFHALIGEDQSGKTTLLHILMGLDFGYEGTVTVAGHPGKALPPGVRSRIRFVPDRLLLEDMRVGDWLSLAQDFSPGYQKKLEEQLMKLFSLEAGAWIKDLSEEENKALQLTAAISCLPALLLLDEPSSLLSEDAWERWMRVLKNLQPKGMTVLLATDRPEDAVRAADGFTWLRDGAVTASGQTDALKISPRAAWVQGERMEV